MSGCSALSRAPWAFHLSSASRPTPTGRRDVTEARPSNPRTTLTPTQTQYPPIPFGFRQRNVKIQQRASRAAGEVFLVLCTMDPAKVRARFSLAHQWSTMRNSPRVRPHAALLASPVPCAARCSPVTWAFRAAGPAGCCSNYPGLMSYPSSGRSAPLACGQHARPSA